MKCIFDGNLYFFHNKFYFSQHIWQTCERLLTKNGSEKSTLYGDTKMSSYITIVR